MADQLSVGTHDGSTLVDSFGRAITYVRVSVTDRCDFRCVYCMAEDMTFLPRRELLTLEELDRLCSAFIEMGTRKIRITGGEPLVRRDIMGLFRSLSQHLEAGTLQEMTLTTNGSQLARFADELASCGVRRINVSLDTLDPGQFKAITRRGDLDRVLSGIDAAQRAGLSVKINVVALKGVNEDEFEPMVRWAHARSMGITFIEVMPLGEIETARIDQHLPLTKVRAQLARHFSLQETDYRTGGPARYVRVARNRRPDWVHHASDPQFLRDLQSSAGDVHRQALHVFGARRRSRFAHPAARLGRERSSQCGDPRGDRPQTQGA